MKVLTRYSVMGDTAGLGHRSRAIAIMEEAYRRGHKVHAMTNDLCLPSYVLLSTSGDPHGFTWVIVDTPDAPRSALINEAHKAGCKVAYIGNTCTAAVDLLWAQNNQQQVILRYDVMASRRSLSDNNRWMVYGGSGDPLGLSQFADDCLPGSNAIIKSSANKIIIRKDHTESIYSMSDPVAMRLSRVAMLNSLTCCKAALIHMGVTAWELAYLGVPVYIVSSSAQHLRLAQKMDCLGLARAWPVIGLPRPQELIIWIRQTWHPKATYRPDGLGVSRLLDKLFEDKS